MTEKFYLRRSLLATPGNVRSKVEKARELPVDVLMLDLEGGVPATDAAKTLARKVLGDALSSATGFATREVAIRINGPRSKWFLEDTAFVSRLNIPTIVVPMVQDAADMIFVERSLANFGAPASLGLILLIETPAGVVNLPQIVEASPRTNGLIGGGLDYAAGLHSFSILPVGSSAGTERQDEDLVYMRQRVLAVGRACGLSVLDAMRPGLISDLDSTRAAIRRARWLGFDGVDLYHPAFVDIANEVFTPSAEELSWADKVLQGSTSMRDDEPASIKIDGRVVLPQHVENARRLKALAREISSPRLARATIAA